MKERIAKRNTLVKTGVILFGAGLNLVTACSDNQRGCIKTSKRHVSGELQADRHPGMEYLAKTCQYENDPRFDKYRDK
jgi:hypothetical protein